jgi:hypothetical protein
MVKFLDQHLLIAVTKRLDDHVPPRLRHRDETR